MPMAVQLGMRFTESKNKESLTLCCFSFNCPDLSSLSKEKCHFNGKSYNPQEKLDNHGCRCYANFGPVARFFCDPVVCPSGVVEDAIRIYKKENDYCLTYIRKCCEFSK